MSTKKSGSKKRVAGIREAKAQFSALIHDASEGREWIISERGVPVAKIVPIEPHAISLEERVRRLEAAGVLEPQKRNARPLPPPLPLEPGLVERILNEDRNRL